MAPKIIQAAPEHPYRGHYRPSDSDLSRLDTLLKSQIQLKGDKKSANAFASNIQRSGERANP
jgi:hypothetical protein